jgi:hypothetical protein
MMKHFTLEYWFDDGWIVGSLREIPSVFSQEKPPSELEENMRDAYKPMEEEGALTLGVVKTKI